MAKEIASLLNEHRIFKDFYNEVPRKNDKCLHLISCFDDVLYVWNNKQRCIDSVSVKAVSSGDIDKVMSLKLMPDVYFDVDRLVPNRSGTIIAVCGEDALAVVKLPERWEEGIVDVECIPLGQRVFIGDSASLRAVRWHPGSPTDSLLAVLTTDECLRLYSALDGEVSWCLSLASHLHLTIPSALTLGETPVDFAFSLPEVEGGVRWPILVLWGNGDVYRISASLEEDANRATLEGPLRVEPPAEDNYGLDASGIAILETEPPLVIIATSTGNFYHCILLPEHDENILHVVERLSLELGLAGETVEGCPASISTDGLSRYLAVTSAGIHAVSLPLASSLRRGNTQAPNQCCNVRALLTTAMRAGAEAAPPLGLTCIDSSTLLVLLSNGRIISFTLGVGPEPENMVYHDLSVLEVEDGNLDEPPLSEYVNRLLSTGGLATCPTLALPPQGKPQDWADIVTRATTAYGAVLASHVKVSAAISQRVENLRATLKRQQAELASLDEGKRSLRDDAEAIAERYEDAADALAAITRRADALLAVVRSVQRPGGTGSLTAGDKALASGLENASERLERLKKDHCAVKVALESVKVTSLTTDEEPIFDTGRHTNILYRHAKHLNAEIATLTERVNKATNLADAWCPRSHSQTALFR